MNVQRSGSFVPSVDMVFRQPDHLSVWRRICNDSRDLHLQHIWHKTAYMRGLWHTIASVPVLPFVPIRPSGMDDISDDLSVLAISDTDTDDTDDISDNSLSLAISYSQDSHILILIGFLIAASWSILYG